MSCAVPGQQQPGKEPVTPVVIAAKKTRMEPKQPILKARPKFKIAGSAAPAVLRAAAPNLNQNPLTCKGGNFQAISGAPNLTESKPKACKRPCQAAKKKPGVQCAPSNKKSEDCLHAQDFAAGRSDTEGVLKPAKDASQTSQAGGNKPLKGFGPGAGTEKRAKGI